MTKYLAISLFTLFCLKCSGQCPTGNLEFNNQADVDNFILNWPNCTSLDNIIIINSSSDENPILNLTGLSNLNSIQYIAIYNMGGWDEELNLPIPGNLNGLESIPTIRHFEINGNSDNPIHLESLGPTANLAGWMGSFDIRNIHFYDELPEYNLLDSIGEFKITNCYGITHTPLFENLEHLVYFSVIGDLQNENQIEVVHIPNGLTDISYSDQTEINPGIEIAFNHNLNALTGGENLEKANRINIAWNSNLESLNVFDGITELESDLYISGCKAAAFESFQNLQKVRLISIEFNIFNNDSPPCTEPTETLNVSIGENATALVLSDRFFISTYGIEVLNFTGKLQSAKGLNLRTWDAESIEGFADLDSLWGGESNDLHLIEPNFVHLPNFTNLKKIKGGIRVSLGLSASPFLNFTGLDSLTNLGRLRVDGNSIDNMHAFESLEGLQGLDSIEWSVQIRDLVNFEDFSGLENLRIASSITLQNLPNLNGDFSFSNFESLTSMRIENTGISEFPEFNGLLSLGSLQVMENPNLEVVHGMNQVQNITGNIELINNESFSSIIMGDEIGMTGNLTITGNPALENCGFSPTICGLLSTANNIQIGFNGGGCQVSSSIFDQCVLNVDEQNSIAVEIFPNPTNNAFSIKGIDKGKIDISHTNGSVVLEPRRFNEIDISDLKAGVYIVRIYSENLIYHRRLIVN